MGVSVFYEEGLNLGVLYVFGGGPETSVGILVDVDEAVELVDVLMHGHVGLGRHTAEEVNDE